MIVYGESLVRFRVDLQFLLRIGCTGRNGQKLHNLRVLGVILCQNMQFWLPVWFARGHRDSSFPLVMY